MKQLLKKELQLEEALAVAVIVIFALLVGIFFINKRLTSSVNTNNQAMTELASLKKQIDDLNNQDQTKRNNDLEAKLKQMEDVYKKSVSVYESLVDLRILSKNNTADLDKAYANLVSDLSMADYPSATTKLTKLASDISAQNAKIIAASIPVAAPASNTPPTAGAGQQTVKTDIGDYVVSIVSADLGSTKVIVDTASDGDCTDNCPVMSVAAYAARSGAYAGINGTYFCPASYPTCAGKTNSYDLLVMNKNKTYFNSGNNTYSNNPAVIFGGSYVRFVGQASEWGRDTGIDGMLSNYPLTVQGGTINVHNSSDPKMGSKGNRSFVGNRGNTVYIGVVFNVTVDESGHVLKALGLDNALNLDSGGSTALWNGGYKVGPGRDIPNAILFVKK
ncbi:hypothetical protein BH10PAT1_BH10PAT1_5940 [soil metagenome]